MKPVSPSNAPLPAANVSTAAPVIPRDKILRLPQVEALTGLRKSTLYALAKKGEFPRQIHIHRRLTGWSEAAVLTWIQSRIQGGAQ